MRQCAVVALGILLAAAMAPADTVYLRNGQVQQGKAYPPKDGKVVIDTPAGPIEVDAAEVIAIIPGGSSGTSSSGPAASKPIVPEGAGAAVGPDVAIERQIVSAEIRRALPIDQMTDPEPVIFTLMQNLSAATPGTATVNLRQQIEQWRSAAHDRKRKAQFEWILPSEFSRRRQLYLRALKEADDLFRKVRVPTPSPGVDPNIERRKLMIPVYDKLDSAARGWADPLLRNFLAGLAALDREDLPQAESFFHKCIDQESLIAAFHQGRADALLATNHALWGLEEMEAALGLRPDARELLSELQQALKKVPGGSIRDPIYLEGQRLLGLYADTDKKFSFSATTRSWFMPGAREWQGKPDSLPTPPYDRLVFRQAIGVPVAANTLLVDAALLKDSTDCYVRIDANTMAPAWFRKISATGKTPPLATLTVPGFEFTVPKLIEDPNGMPSEAPMAAHAVPAYAEMGSMIRKATGKLGGAATDGSISVTGTLLPGESAAPVFVGEGGALIGFLAGKTDINSDNGGPDRFIPLSQFSQTLRQLKTAVPDQSMYGRLKRTPAPRAAPGESFLVTGIVTELLE